MTASFVSVSCLKEAKGELISLLALTLDKSSLCQFGNTLENSSITFSYQKCALLHCHYLLQSTLICSIPIWDATSTAKFKSRLQCIIRSAERVRVRTCTTRGPWSVRRRSWPTPPTQDRNLLKDSPLVKGCTSSGQLLFALLTRSRTSIDGNACVYYPMMQIDEATHVSVLIIWSFCQLLTGSRYILYHI